jgi:hypothetical protein
MFASSVPLVVFVLAFLILLLLTVVLFSPIVVTLDSSGGQLRLSWLVLIECLLPLPGKAGKVRIVICGRPASFAIREPASPPPAQPIPTPPGPGPGRSRKHVSKPRRRFRARFLRRCLSDSVIRRRLVKQLARLGRGVWRSLVLTRWQSSVSLSDPAFNGMLMGALAQAGPPLNSNLSVNFVGENSLFIEARVYPHRLVKAFFLFLTGLPYVALFRLWRASSALKQAAH